MSNDPHAQYKHATGPLKGAYRQALPTLYRNLHLAAIDATPGVPVWDYYDGDGNKPYPRTLTEGEAKEGRERFRRLCKEAEDRTPEVYAAWREHYLDWKSGDVTQTLMRPDQMANTLRSA